MERNFTKCHDNNNKPLYEGDKVKMDGNIYTIELRNGSYYAGHRPIGWTFCELYKVEEK